MNTVLKKYGAALFSLAILILTAVAAVPVWNLVALLQMGSIVVSSIISVGILNLLPGKWPGGLKTGVDLLGAAIALVLPFALLGHITNAEIVLVVVGFLKAAATELGVVIRTDNVLPVTGSGTTSDPAVITSLPTAPLVADPKAVAAGPMDQRNVTNSQ